MFLLSNILKIISIEVSNGDSVKYKALIVHVLNTYNITHSQKKKNRHSFTSPNAGLDSLA